MPELAGDKVKYASIITAPKTKQACVQEMEPQRRGSRIGSSPQRGRTFQIYGHGSRAE